MMVLFSTQKIIKVSLLWLRQPVQICFSLWPYEVVCLFCLWACHWLFWFYAKPAQPPVASTPQGPSQLDPLCLSSRVTRVCKPCAALGRVARTCCQPCTIPGHSCFILASSLHAAVWFKVQSWFSFDLGRLLSVCVRLAAGMWTIRNVYLSKHHAEFHTL